MIFREPPAGLRARFVPGDAEPPGDEVTVYSDGDPMPLLTRERVRALIRAHAIEPRTGFLDQRLGVRAILREWSRGCSNTVGSPPWRCWPCLRDMLGPLWRAARRGDF